MPEGAGTARTAVLSQHERFHTLLVELTGSQTLRVLMGISDLPESLWRPAAQGER